MSLSTAPSAARPSSSDRPLRIALLAYRGRAHCGGQGVYVRHLSRELARLGHHVEVLAGQPYPPLDDGVSHTPLPSLDLYRDDDPFRTPALAELRDVVDVLEVAGMWSAGFPEPLTFSLRAWRHLRGRAGDFDIVHDNQCLGYGLLGVQRLGLPVVATVHHPITVDRRVELAEARGWREMSVRRWYGFARMQRRVARRMDGIATVSASSAGDIVRDFGVRPSAIERIPIGVDAQRFRPRGQRVPGRIVAMASADVPMKGLPTLVEALAKIRTERDAHLLLVGCPRPGGATAEAIARCGVGDAVECEAGLSDEALAQRLASAEIAVVPSLYEGFSLPAVEAMACATPLVATTGGALPEVAGRDGATAQLVAPGDVDALAGALRHLLADEGRRQAMGARARRRVLERFTWRAAAERTAVWYAATLAGAGGRGRGVRC